MNTPTVLTITPNPSLDRTLRVPRLDVGEVLRATATRKDAGGKGINVSRALQAHGVPTVAVFPVGGGDGAQLGELLAEPGVATVAVPVRGETRSNVTVVDDDGRTTKLNAPGVALHPAEVDALLGAVAGLLAEHTAHPHAAPPTVVGAGSLPAGAGDDFYVRLGVVCAAAGARLVLDTSGAPLARAVEAGAASLVKPNDDELAELVGRPLRTVGDVVRAAREVIGAGADEVLVSLGAHGALLVTPARSWWAGGAALTPRSTVGAGDVTLAGFLAARGALPSAQRGAAQGGTDPCGADPSAALRAAVSWGRAAVLLPGSAVPTPTQIHLDDVRVVADPHPTTAVEEL